MATLWARDVVGAKDLDTVEAMLESTIKATVRPLCWVNVGSTLGATVWLLIGPMLVLHLGPRFCHCG